MTIPFGQGSLLCRDLENILPGGFPEEESRSPVYLCDTQHGAVAVISSVDLFTKASTAGFCVSHWLVALWIVWTDGLGDMSGKIWVYRSAINPIMKNEY